MDIGNIVSVIIGGVIVIAGQLLLSFFNSRTEKNKLQHEDIRNRSEAIGRFRERRVQPIIDALDRATRRWDADSYFELADMVGFEGHIVDTKSEDYEKERKKRRQEYFDKLQEDISAVKTIHDKKVRSLATSVLWKSATLDSYNDEYYADLEQAYRELENWIFNP
jgi:hypothetical protein